MPSKRSQIPESIRVGAYDIKVVLKKLPEDDEGKYEPKNCLISLDIGTSLKRLRMTLMHELLHAVWDTAELPQDKAIKEEEAVSKLSAVLAQVLRDNPKLLTFLVGGRR